MPITLLLKDFYDKLQAEEGLTPIQLVAAWPTALKTKIRQEFSTAVVQSNIKSLVCSIPANTTNQSRGNRMEAFAVRLLGNALPSMSIGKCPNQGYPDRKLMGAISGHDLPLEVKATTKWDPKDSNRRVLTSSSNAIRQNFAHPIHHLLLTLIYKMVAGGGQIDRIRLDFLEPDTQVNVRLEASVNHKLLDSGYQTSAVF